MLKSQRKVELEYRKKGRRGPGRHWKGYRQVLEDQASDPNSCTEIVTSGQCSSF